MSAALSQFKRNLAYVRNLVALSRSLDAATTPALDVSDILRAAIVMAVSALDHYVHQRTREGMMDVHRGSLPPPDAFLRFPVGLERVRDALADPTKDDWLSQAIADRHSYLAFQKPDSIADALRHVSSVALWPAVSADLGRDIRDVKTTLTLIVDRRNKIAHEADADPTLAGARWPISDQLVTGAIDFIEEIVSSIERCV